MDMGRERRIKAAVDTNVLLGRHRNQILLFASLVVYTLVTSSYIVEELRSMMEQLGWRHENREALLQTLLTVAMFVDYRLITGGSYDKWLTDPDDHPIMATALAGQVDYLVTDNTRHFPPKRRFAAITIVTCDGFLSLLQR